MTGHRSDSGLYILWLRLSRDVRVPVGALGEVSLEKGVYAYVGSAQRNRLARVRRHLRRDKVKRWHIDYLRPYGDVVAVTLSDGAKADECRLANYLIERWGALRAVPRFGASDCRCGGHLLAVPEEALHSVTSGMGWPSGTCFMAMELMQ
ncbi:MAG: DUF123 domain-containing protein [Firmicutes bacterium]|nr:DUF123 domain-containing protein [Bacillota bacterium]